MPAVKKSGPDACGKTGQHKLRLEEVSVGGLNCLFIELSDICIILCGTLYLYFNFLFFLYALSRTGKKRTKLGALDSGHVEQS